MFAIYKREMRSYFTTPIGYIFLAIFFVSTSTNNSSVPTTSKSFAEDDTLKGVWVATVFNLDFPKTPTQNPSVLKKELDKIAEKSGLFLLLPIGADHLGIPKDIKDQILSNNSVDLNEELVDLVKYQTAYAASAQVFNTCNSCLNTLMSLGG